MSAGQQYYQTPGYVAAAGTVLPAMNIVAVFLRFLARRRQKQPVQADDWLTLLSAILAAAIGISITYGVSQKALAYRIEMPPDFNGDPLTIVTSQSIKTSKIQFAFALMLPVTLGCIKLSILLFYFRIFAITTASITYWLLVAFIVFVGMWSIGFFVAALFQCRLHFWAFWGSAMDLDTNCPGTMYLDLSLCITDFFTDIVIVCIPAPSILRMNLTISNKVTAIAVFLLGSVTIIASLLRLIMNCQIVAVGFSPEADAILVITESLYWGMIESGIGILAACFPVFQALFRKTSWVSVKSNGLREINAAANTEAIEPKRQAQVLSSIGTDEYHDPLVYGCQGQKW